jgi:serine phosphatase RsbU (regulator of sigma subunit)
LRNARRAGADMVEQARLATSAIAEHAQGAVFVTGQLVRVDLKTAAARMINAGHPLPLRLRGGRVNAVELDAEPPFGIVRGHRYHVQRLPLEPGDRIFFVTDGILERNAAGLDIPAIIRSSKDEHPREAVQHLMSAVLDASGGKLADDATALCLDWNGGPQRDRDSSGGANR